MNLGKLAAALFKVAKENPALVIGVVGAVKPLVKAVKRERRKPRA